MAKTWHRALLLPAMSVLFLSACAGNTTQRQQYKRITFDEADYRLVWPLPVVTDARITSRFGPRVDPISSRQSFHGGVDLAGEMAGPVHAAGRGEVIFAGSRGGYGLLVIIDHGRGLNTYYGHCSRLLVKRGDSVDRGDVVALIGDSGRVTGPHLHFETRKHGQPFDPFILLPRLRKL